MKLEERILFIFIFIFCTKVHAQSLITNREPRKVDLEWDVVAEAKGYEVEIYEINQDGTSNLEVKERVFSPKLGILIRPGKYKFHLRSIDHRGVPGEWSEFTDLDVQLPNPVLISPYTDETIIALELEQESVSFSWKEVLGANFYLFEIWDSEHKFYHKKIVEDANYSIELVTAKSYLWKVSSLLLKDDTTPVNEEGKPFFLKGGAIDHPVVEISAGDGVKLKWDNPKYAENFELYLLKKSELNQKWVIVLEDHNFSNTRYTSKEKGLFRFALRAKSDGRKSSSYYFIEYEYNGSDLDVRLSRVQVDMNVTSDNPFFYSLGLEKMELSYSGETKEYDTSVASTLQGYRVFLEAAYQDFYSYFRHRTGLNTQLLKNIDKSIILNELHYMTGLKKIYKKIPYELSGGLFVKEDLYINANRFDKTVEYEKVTSYGPIFRIDSWYSLNRYLDFGTKLKLYYHMAAHETPNNEELDSTLSYSLKAYLDYKAKENVSYSLFYGLYQSNIKFQATEGDANDADSNSLASYGAINTGTSVGSSFGFVMNSTF